MKSYAVVETGGKQYLVKVGDKVTVERPPGEVGKAVSLSAVLAISDGKQLEVGSPQLKAHKVAAKVVDQIRAPKVVSFKKKRRKGYARKKGHRQEQTVLQIESIS